MNKKYIAVALATISFALTSCGQNDQHDNSVIKVGTIAGPETELMQVARDYAKENYDTDIVIVEFTDYVMPNAALHNGDIDANAYQHIPYLEAAMEANSQYDFVVIAKTFIYPMGIYSNKISDLNALPENATVAIPNDPSNSARALLLLESAGLIEVDREVGYNLTPRHVTENPKNLRFRELEAAQLPRALSDVDIAVINTNYAVPAGLIPSKDAIYIEGSDSPYANLIVVNKVDAESDKFANLINAYQSTPVVEKAKELFGEQAIPAWDES